MPVSGFTAWRVRHTSSLRCRCHSDPATCPKAKMRPGSLVPSWPQVDSLGKPGWNLGPSVSGLSSGLHSCHGLPFPGCSAVPHAAMDILAWVLCVSGPWLPALALLPRTRPTSLGHLSCSWWPALWSSSVFCGSQSWSLQARVSPTPTGQLHLPTEMGMASRPRTKSAYP